MKRRRRAPGYRRSPPTGRIAGVVSLNGRIVLGAEAVSKAPWPRGGADALTPLRRHPRLVLLVPPRLYPPETGRRNHDPGRPCSILFLVTVMREVPPLKRWLLASDKALTYALQVWAAIDTETGEVYAYFDMGNCECPEGQLLRSLLRPDAADSRHPREFDWLVRDTSSVLGRRGSSLMRIAVNAVVYRCQHVTRLTRKEAEEQLATVPSCEFLGSKVPYRASMKPCESLRSSARTPRCLWRS